MLRRIESVRNTKTDRTAVVYRDSAWSQYVVKFSAAGVAVPGADYYTDDKADAQHTARAVVWGNATVPA